MSTLSSESQTTEKEKKKKQTFFFNLGEQLKLDVELSHPNVPGCRFIKDDVNTPIRKDKRTRILSEGTHYTLIIDGVLPAGDTGVYQFLGPTDNLRSTCQVTVQSLPSKITQPLKDVTLQENQNLSLEARVDNEHAPVTWFINGKEVPPGGEPPHITTMSKGRRHTLVVQKVNAKQDAGQYEIRTPDDASACQVTIEELGTPPADFTKKLQNIDTQEFQTVEFQCETNRDNLPVEWFKDGKPIEDNEHYSIEDNGQVHKLIIHDVLTTDQGSYSCQIKANGKGTSATLKVKEMPADFVRQLESIEAITGDTISFECQLNKPNIKVKWLKDNKPIASNDRVKPSIDTDNPQIHLLTIQDLNSKDAGTYTCAIDQPSGKKSSASLTVQSITVKLVEPIQDTTVNENENLVLKFTLSHELKQIPVQWKVNNQLIVPDHDRIQIEQDGKSFFLTINQVKPNEQGSYSAEIPAHKIQTTAQIKVKPEDIRILKDLHIVPDDQQSNNIILEIQLSKPLPNDIVLLKDGVKPKRKIPVENLKNGTYRFTLENVTPDDSGLYEIPIGPNLSSSCQVTIQPKQKEQPTIPYKFQGTIELNPKLPKEDDNVRCTVTLNQPVDDQTVEWYLNGQLIVPNDRFTISADGPRSILTIKNIRPDDAGQLECRIPSSNEKLTTDLKVKEKPLTLLKPLTADKDKPVEGDDVILSCQFSRKPKKIEVYKDGKLVELDQNLNDIDATFTIKLPKTKLDDKGKYTVKGDDVETSYTLRLTPNPVKFTKQLKWDKDSPYEGETVQATLTLNRIPDRPIQWFKGRVALPTESTPKYQYSQMDCTFTLTIPSVELKDADTYSVKLPDDTQSSARLKVLETPVKVVVPLTLEPVEPILGSEFILSITLDRDVKNTFKWVKAGKDLSLKRDARISFKQETNPDNQNVKYILTIRDAKPEDEGTYRFEVEPHNISESKLVKLTEPKILIVKCDDKLTGKLGSPLTLTCEVNLPQGHVIWYHDGIKLTSSESTPLKSTGLVVKNTDVVRTLTINSLKKDDFGSYTVKTKDDKREIQISQSTDDDQLKVLEHPPKVLDLDQNDQLILSIVTNRKCPIEFSKANKPLKTTEKFDQTKSTYTVTFTIDKVDFPDEGIYKVILPNTKYEYQTEVFVHNPYERQKTDALEGELALLFVKKLEDQKVKETDQVILECQFNRAPNSAPIWTRNDQQLTSNDHIQLIQDETRLQLIIPKASIDDHAEYTLNVENLRGHAFIDVLSDRIRFTEKLYDTIVKVGSPIVLQCKLSHPDVPITWKRDGQPIDSKLTEIDGCTHTLRIPTAELDHSGKYSAHYNDEIETSCSVSVQTEPVFARELPPELTLKVGSNLLLDVETTRPNKSVQWYRNGKLIPRTGDARHRFTDDKYNHALKLSKVTLQDDDDTIFECECDNVRTKCRVLVQTEPLVFSKELKDIKYELNDRLTFVVRMNKRPSDNARWLHNGQPIQASDRIQIIYDDNEHEAKLIINDANENDQGKYMYDAVEARTSCTAEFKQTPLEFVQELRNRSVKQDQPVQFECEINKIPTRVVWLLNGQVIDNDNDRFELISSPSKKKYTLKIKQTLLTDAGDVTVKIDDQIQSNATLEVKGIPIEFVKNLTGARVNENETVNFLCELNKPNIHVKWFLDGQPLPQDDEHFAIQSKGPVHTLTIRKVAWNEGGEYKCVADGGAKTSATLVVKAIPVTFTKLLEERTCNFGESVEFVCETSKACRVEWFAGDKRLSSQQYDIQTNDNQHILRIPKVKLTDKGWYKCTVQDAFTEAKLIVIDKAVELIEPLVDQNVQENENTTLVCQLSKPDMDVVWYHNDRRIFFTPQSRVRAKQIDCYYKLLLDDIEFDDQGLYEMRCENIKTSCHLTVKKLETTFLDHLRNLTVQEGDTARFQCRLSKISSNIQWFKDGIRIVPSDRTVYSVKGDLLSLTIHNAQLEDQGNYRCMVDNQHTDATLTVEPLPAMFTKYLPKTWTVFGDEPLELSCQLSKSNVPVTWLRDGLPIDDQTQIRNDGLRYSLLIPHGAQPGRYTIRIDDGQGLESTCQVSVENQAENDRKKPRIIRGLEDLTVFEGDALDLQCQFEGDDVEATWFANGVMLRSNVFTTINLKPNELAQLLLKEVYFEDAGLYKLRLKNKYGEVSTSCTLTIRQRERTSEERKSSADDLVPPK